HTRGISREKEFVKKANGEKQRALSRADELLSLLQNVVYDKIAERLPLATQEQVADGLRSYYDSLQATEQSPETHQRRAGFMELEAKRVLAEGNATRAESLMMEAVAIRRTQAASDPSNAARQSELAAALGTLGQVLTSAGRLAEGRQHFEEALTIN